MLGAEHLLADRQRALIQGLKGCVLPLRLIQFRQIVERGAHDGMLGAMVAFCDLERLLCHHHGLVVLALAGHRQHSLFLSFPPLLCAPAPR